LFFSLWLFAILFFWGGSGHGCVVVVVVMMMDDSTVCVCVSQNNTEFCLFREMDSSTVFKFGAGLSVVSGLLYLFARREYAQADAIKNAKHIKVRDHSL
jgi:hypothetical protein